VQARVAGGGGGAQAEGGEGGPIGRGVARK
jgi:hypothetical protein